MDCTPPNAAIAVAEVQQALADTVLIELELGLTFLDVAANTRQRKHAQRSVNHAITALRTANKFLPQIQPGIADLDLIEQRRKQLARRLGAICGVDVLAAGWLRGT